MLRRNTYGAISLLALFGLFLFFAVKFESLLMGYVAQTLLLLGILTALFGVIMPILTFHIYRSVLSEGQREVLVANPIFRTFVRVGSNGELP